MTTGSLSSQVDPISYKWIVKYKHTGWRTAPFRNCCCLHLHCYLVFQSRLLADVKNFSKEELKKGEKERKYCLELLSDSSAGSLLQMTHTPETRSTVFRKDSTVSACWVPPTLSTTQSMHRQQQHLVKIVCLDWTLLQWVKDFHQN